VEHPTILLGTPTNRRGQVVAAEMTAVFAAAQDAITGRVQEWSRRVTDWTVEADALVQRSELRQRRVSVAEEQAIADRMAPERQLVWPLLVVAPADHLAAADCRWRTAPGNMDYGQLHHAGPDAKIRHPLSSTTAGNGPSDLAERAEDYLRASAFGLPDA
jgi:hypothetical protein